MEERHLHFNLLTGLWLWLFLLVWLALAKYMLNRYNVPGLTPLHKYAFGG